MTLPDPESLAAAGSLLRERNYVLFWLSRFLNAFAGQAQTVTIAWQVYAIARRHGDMGHAAFDVGLIGLAEFLPVFLLALVAGGVADRFNRRKITLICLAVEVTTGVVLMVMAQERLARIWPIFLVALVFGTARAFFNPANTAMGPMLAPRALLPKAVAYTSLAWQSASIIGPAAGGLLCAISPAAAYGVSGLLFLSAAGCIFAVRGVAKPPAQDGSHWALAKEGLRYVWTHKLVLGATSLDLFAVLLGGATALLPVYARDVLHVGAVGYGVMRSAPAVGAGLVAATIAVRPITRNAGHAIFYGVGVFGVATLVFALSKSPALSVVALAVLGAADMLSVYVRSSLIQIATPDAMRGRVAAVTGLFIASSNELGEFESGVAARLLGPIGAAVFGGVGALIVTGVWAKLFPDLRKADRLS